jgi:hypothetical protein
MDYKLFRLNIKGSLSACLAEVCERGLTPLGWHEYEGKRDCSIDVESCAEYLGAWFREDDRNSCPNGYPDGSLLLYTSHESYTKPLSKLSQGD